jgi:hypothetical protein
MLKKFFIVAGSLSWVYLVACSSDNSMAGGTIDPNSIAEVCSSSFETDNPEPNLRVESSSSVVEISSSSESYDFPIIGSSSSRAVIESSSDIEDGDKNLNPDIIMSSSSETNDYSPVAMRNLSLQCLEDVIYVNMGDTIVLTPDLAEPAAYKSVEGDSVNVLLQNIYFAVPCGEDKPRFLQEVVEKGRVTAFFAEDTLVVDVSRSRMYSFGCSCVAVVDFTLDKKNSEFNYTVFDRKDTLSVQK